MKYCRGRCFKVRLPVGWKYGNGVAYCRTCDGAMEVKGRPRTCKCCGENLRYKRRRPRR